MSRRDLIVENGVMRAEGRLSAVGNSMGLIVSKPMLAHAGLQAGSKLQITVTRGEIRIELREDYSKLPFLITDQNRR